MTTQQSNILIIAGPTAGGKSAKALQRAAETNGVIINCDSMQIYDDLPILAAQPNAEDLEAAPHRLYAALHPNEPCSAGIWVRMATPIIEEALENGQTPIICGGTFFYIKALMEGLSPIPDIPDEIRAATIPTYEDLGSPGFYEALKARDPETAARFHPNHSARLMRAWEVLEATGKSLSHWQDQPNIPPPAHWRFDLDIIMPERADLHERINTRFDEMIRQGALDEVAAFTKRIKSGEVREDSLLTNALGFQDLRSHLAGKISLEEATQNAKALTRQYAKRQITWLRSASKT